MKNFSLPAVLISTGISFAVGFATAWHFIASDTPPEQAAATSNAAVPAAANQFADIWNKTGTAPQPSPSSAPQVRSNATIDEQKMRELALSDPTYLRNLIQRYGTEEKPDMKEAIKSVLATIPTPEVQAFFARMATSNDPLQRKEGYAMLQQMAPDSPELRAVLKQALATEQSPDVLTQAIAALQPAMVDPAESDAIVSQLRNLSQHQDPTVRSQSIHQLAQWDKKGAAQDRLIQALGDSAPEVRQAAIFAAAQSAPRSESLKAALLGMIANPNETREIKGSALQVLEQFSLNKEEYARYTQARTQIGF